MALSVTHQYVSIIADDGDATKVQPSDWNDTHTLTGATSPAQGGRELPTTPQAPSQSAGTSRPRSR